jgi:hypothetical protein
MAKYKVVVVSNGSYGKEYNRDSRDVLRLAGKYGRCDGGEKVQIYQGDRLISEVRWTPENGGRYYRCAV